MNKINFNGEYMPFYGITLISMCCYTESNKLLKLYKYMSTKINFIKYYKLLPPDSYHVTINDLICSKKGYQDFTINILNNMSKILYVHNKTTLLDQSYQTTIIDVYCKTSIGIDLHLSRDSISQFNDYLNLEQKYPFHLTLGYQYNDNLNNDSLALQELNDIIDYIMKNIKNIYCESPKVCTFRDITQFTPLT